jgi:hypothetical protein
MNDLGGSGSKGYHGFRNAGGGYVVDGIGKDEGEPLK